MDSTTVVRPLQGQGLVARTGDFLLVCAEAAEADRLLGVLAEVAAAGGDGSMLVRRVAALVAADLDGRFPDCAVSGRVADGGLAVLVYGAATARISAGDMDVALSGADAITSVTRLVAGPVTAVRLQLPGAAAANPRSRLDSGVVVGAGIIFSREGFSGDGSSGDGSSGDAFSGEVSRDEPAVQARDEPAVAADPSDQSFAADLSEQSFAAVEPRAPSMPPPAMPPAPPGPEAPPAPETGVSPEALPAGAQAAAEPEAGAQASAEPEAGAQASAEPERPAVAESPISPPATWEAPPAPQASTDPPISGTMVHGVVCPNNHFIDPAAPNCPSCGVSMAHQTLVIREGPRPALGVLVVDDGSVVPLDTDYVVGREPHNDPDVVAGSARSLRIVDAEGVVSRRHARISLVGWDVHVVDLGSANGTFVDAPGDPQHRQLVANQPLLVRPGTLITLGRRWFRFETTGNPAT